MNYIKENINISSVIINPEYSVSGNTVSYAVNDNEEDIKLTVKSLSNIRKLSNLTEIKTVKEYFFSFYNALNLDTNICHYKLLGKVKANEYLNYLKQIINESLKLVTNYHLKIFPKRLKCYSQFNSVTLDGEILELPAYDHSGVTGRTGIKKGFNFLTLKKDLRKNLKPLNKDKILIEIDFKSCEPFFYLLSQGFNIDNNDVYAWIANKYKIDISNRDHVKRGILSMIYGANNNTISRIMKIKELKINKIKEDLGINKLKKILEKEFEEKGFILNYYGRPITSNSNLVNYWIQSSTVDYCSLAFYQFIEEKNIKPSYFIHDSMTIEIEGRKLQDIKTITYLTENISNISIPVEIEKLG